MNDLRPAIAEFLGLVRSLPGRWIFLILALGWAALFTFLGNNTFGYLDTPSLFSWLANAYQKSADDGYCALVPFVVIGLLIWKRSKLSEIPKQAWFPGLFLLSGGALFHMVGYLIQQPRISAFGFFFGLYGLTGMVWGKAWLSRTFFPMFLLLFMIPVGTLQDELTLPLRLFVTKSAVFFGNLFLNLGYQSHGSNIFNEFGKPVFDVAPACSGIRSLVSLFILASIYAFTRFESYWKRLVVVAAAIPLAMLGNLIRLVVVLIVGRAVNIQAGSAIEQKLGLVTFVVALGGLFLLGRQLGESLENSTGGSISAEPVQ